MTAAEARGGSAGLVVAGSAVILTGEWLGIARQAALVADVARLKNGAPRSASYIALAEALTAAMSADPHDLTSAMAARGQTDMLNPAVLKDVLQQEQEQEPYVTIADAAQQLGMSKRQTRRLAPRLGGRLIGGQWLLDQYAIDEHRKGSA